MGFKHEVIKNYFDSAPSFFPRIEYSIEVEPLGTGGGIKNALSLVKMDNFFVFNGDTFLDLDYRRMQENHLGNGADITVGSCFLENTDRYGVMHVCEEGEIIGFEEKQGTEPGIINGGVYLINRHRLERVLSQIKIGAFSFEEVILSNFDLGLVRRYFPSAGYFLDIGIPSDYERACKELFLD
jgi:D-glycero-alpha-D-manno-heptose 1-phosphate guanylyltransferase